GAAERAMFCRLVDQGAVGFGPSQSRADGGEYQGGAGRWSARPEKNSARATGRGTLRAVDPLWPPRLTDLPWPIRISLPSSSPNFPPQSARACCGIYSKFPQPTGYVSRLVAASTRSCCCTAWRATAGYSRTQQSEPFMSITA